jgi:predicted lipoprotein with Yx(FWY)xxD motif
VKSLSDRGTRGRSAALSLVVALAFGAALAAVADAENVPTWSEVSMPPGFQVIVSELEGPVFADAEGRTLYEWPQHVLRNGYSGEAPGTPGCYDEPTTVTAGLMSPYPAGIPLPELDTRPACTDLWPPVLAEEGAEPVGEWTLLERRDGSRQWAYEEQPLYTSVRDRRPGDVFGGTRRRCRRALP